MQNLRKKNVANLTLKKLELRIDSKKKRQIIQKDEKK